MSNKKPFKCPKCCHRSDEFHMVCPECGQRFVRDYIDTRMYPRDPDLSGICTSRFWIWVYLLFTIGMIILGLLLNLGFLSGGGQ